MPGAGGLHHALAGMGVALGSIQILPCGTCGMGGGKAVNRALFSDDARRGSLESSVYALSSVQSIGASSVGEAAPAKVLQRAASGKKKKKVVKKAKATDPAKAAAASAAPPPDTSSSHLDSTAAATAPIAPLGPAAVCESGTADEVGPPVPSSSCSPPPLRRAKTAQSTHSLLDAAPAVPSAAFAAPARGAAGPKPVAAEAPRKKRSGWLLVTNEQSASTWRKIVWRELFCTASRQGILIYKTREDNTPKYTIPLTEIDVIGRASEGVGGRKFCLTVLGHDFQYYFQARNDEHCGEWCGFLTTLLQQNMERILKARRGSKVQDVAPVQRPPPGQIGPAQADEPAANPDPPASAKKRTPRAAKRRSHSAGPPPRTEDGPVNPLDPKRIRPVE